MALRSGDALILTWRGDDLRSIVDHRVFKVWIYETVFGEITGIAWFLCLR